MDNFYYDNDNENWSFLDDQSFIGSAYEADDDYYEENE